MNSSYFYNSLNMFSHPSLIPQNYPYPLFNHQYNYQDYYQPQKEKPQPNIDMTFKTDITKWQIQLNYLKLRLKQLNQPELFSIFTIKNLDTVQILLKMYAYDQYTEPSSYAKKQNSKFSSDQLDQIFLIRKQSNDQQEMYRATTQLISHMKILGGEQLFGILCFEEQIFSDLDQLLNLLSKASDGNFLSYQPRIIPNRNFVDDLLWFNPSSFQTFGSWLVNELEKNIALCYKKKRFSQLEINNEDMETFWKGLDKGKLISSAFNNYEEDAWYQHLVRLRKAQDESEFRVVCEKEGFIQNIVLTRFSEMIEPVTCIAKSLYRVVASQYRSKLEQDLIAGEELEKKEMQRKKKGRKGQQKKKQSAVEVLSFFTFESETEKEVVSVQKVLVYSTHPNSRKLSESKSFGEGESWAELALVANGCEGVDDGEAVAGSMEQARQLVEGCLKCYRDDLEFESQQVRELKKERKRQKKNEKIQKLKQENRNYEKKLKEEKHERHMREMMSAKEEIWSQDDDAWKDPNQQAIPPFRNSNLADLSQKSNTTLPTTSKDTSEEEVLFSQFQKKPYKKTKNQKTQTSYYKGYQIKSDSTLKLARSNNFPLRKQLEEPAPQSQEIPPIKEEATERQEKTQEKRQDKHPPVQESAPLLDAHLEDQAKQMLYEKVTRDIHEYTDDLIDVFFRLLPQRTVVFNRIQLLIQQMFQSEIRLFGSCVTGLALPDSDIDVGILGFELFPRPHLITLINQLVNVFQQCPWIISIKPIYSCARSTPRFRMISVSRIQAKSRSRTTDRRTTVSPILSLTKKEYLNVDISFNKMGEHFGQISTEKVLDWIKECPELQQLVLAFKALIKSRGLNEPYRGGLSSYSQIIMIKCFLQQFQRKASLGELFAELCDFYGNQFNAQKMGIRIGTENEYSSLLLIMTRQQGFFPLENQKYPITIVSPISDKVISQTSKQACKVLLELKKASQNVCKLKMVYYDYLLNKKKRRYRKNNLERLNEATKDNFICTIVNTL